jgi:2-polyprenyl-6-methoxyphenol hydroxylase-like FAD-dependent oxidoreductase
MRNQKILICGAGIAGPTLAYWLRRYGFEPTLVERASALRDGGYMIDFWGLGYDVAEKMGLVPALSRVCYKIEDIRIVNERGARVGGFGVEAIRSALGERYLSLMRSDLARLIYESLGGGVRTIFGDTIVGLEQNSDSVRVSFEHTPSERFDLVIGAAGLHSPVRRLAFGPESRFEKHLGYYTASFSVDGYSRRDPHAYVSYAAPGRQVSRYALRGDRTVFFFAFAAEPNLLTAEHAVGAQKAILREVFGKDGWECPEILALLDAGADFYFDAVSQVWVDTWSRGRVALTGDACFCPSLLAGQGAALAMAAAYILAGELKSANGDHYVAFRHYEELLHPFMIRKQRAAQKFAGSFAPKTKLGILFRNQVTRLMNLPLVSKMAMGGLLTDSLVLPTYG